MNRNLRRFLALCLGFATVLTCGCDDEPRDATHAALLQFGSTSSKFVQARTVSNAIVSMRFLPQSFFEQRAALQQRTRVRQAKFNSIPDAGRAATFQLTIASKDDRTPLIDGIASRSDFDQRMRLLCFQMTGYLKLDVGDTVFAPVLTNFENDFGLSHSVRLSVVFPISSKQLFDRGTPFSVTFVDPAFGTGVNRFTFDATVLSDNIPSNTK